MELIQIKSFNETMDAYLLKVKIENEGIKCYLKDELTHDIFPLAGDSLSGVKLLVERAYFYDVLDILDTVPEMVLKNPNGQIVVCTKCRSKQVVSAVYEEKEGVGEVFRGVLRSIKMINPRYWDKLYQCLKCETKFEF